MRYGARYRRRAVFTAVVVAIVATLLIPSAYAVGEGRSLRLTPYPNGVVVANGAGFTPGAPVLVVAKITGGSGQKSDVVKADGTFQIGFQAEATYRGIVQISASSGGLTTTNKLQMGSTSGASPAAGTPAAPAATGAKVPVGPVKIWAAEYNVGNASEWGNQCEMTAKCAAPNLTFVPGEGGVGKAAKITLNDGDSNASGERAEFSAYKAGPTDTKEGDERWYEFSLQFPKKPDSSGGWFIITQWHSHSGSPPLALNVNKEGQLVVGGDGTDKSAHKPIGPVPVGKWSHYVLHVKFSNSASTGFVEAWENGKLKIPKTPRATMSSESNYLKQGIYRDSSLSTTESVMFDYFRITGPAGSKAATPAATGTSAEEEDS